MLHEADLSRGRLLSTAQKDRGLSSLLCWFRRLGHYCLLDCKIFREAIALRVGADVCTAAAVWTEGVYMAFLANTVLATFQGIGQYRERERERVKRAFQKVCLPSVLELPGLDRGDGSHPDGIIVFPLVGVELCMCVDSFSVVHLNRSAMEACTASDCAEERKYCKYAALAEAHQFAPIAVETTGVYGGSTGIILTTIT